MGYTITRLHFLYNQTFDIHDFRQNLTGNETTWELRFIGTLSDNGKKYAFAEIYTLPNNVLAYE